jgi:hypothetical protein
VTALAQRVRHPLGRAFARTADHPGPQTLP